MSKRVPPLTQLQIRNAKPADKPYKLADGGGLYIEITPAGNEDNVSSNRLLTTGNSRVV